jgi:cobalt-zinc-cadmium efflux system protein
MFIVVMMVVTTASSPSPSSSVFSSDLQKIRRHLRISLIVTIAIVAVEFVGGVVSNSISLISDAGHVFTDSMAIALSLFAVTLAAKQHKGSMTFGYHRAEVLAALANGVLLSAISVWVSFEAYQRIFSPRQIDTPLMLTTAVIGLAGNVLIMLILRSDRNKNLNIKSSFTHVIYDTVSSVAVISVALIAHFTAIYAVDPIVAFLIAGLIARSAYSIVKESAHILLEGAPVQVNVHEIQDLIKKIDKVLDVHDLHVWTISTGMNALSGHVVVADQMLSQSNMVIQAINKALVERYNIHHTTIQVEPEHEISFFRKT